MQRPTEDRFLLAASELKNRIAVLMGGACRRAADLRRRRLDGGGRRSSTGDGGGRGNGDEIRNGPKAAQGTYAAQPQALLAAAQDRVFSAVEATGREIDVAVRDLV